MQCGEDSVFPPFPDSGHLLFEDLPVSKTTIIRRAKDKQNPYAQISRDAIQDDRLTWQAKGLLAYLLSLPGDWQIYITELANHVPNGITSTRSTVKCLLTYGYLSKNIVRDDKKRIVQHEYIVNEAPASARIIKTKATIRKPKSRFSHTTNNTYTKQPRNKRNGSQIPDSIQAYHNSQNQAQEHAIHPDIIAAGLIPTHDHKEH